MKNCVASFALLLLLLCQSHAFAQSAPIRLSVDATDAARKILHAQMRIPAKPGELTLVYPKWIPGEHGPTGPITDLVGIKVSAGGKPVAWRRDAEDMFALHLTVPDGVDAVEISYDFLAPPSSGGFSAGASATPQLLVLSWNQVLLYPKGASARDIEFTANLRLPERWQYATALTVARDSADGIEFAPASLETLVDSPLLAGAHFRSIDLSPGMKPAHRLNIAADSDAALEIKPEDARHFSQLTAETEALFGARHYRSYDFLLTLSDHVAHFGLEHHQSSDNRVPERYLIDDDIRKAHAILLPHEMTHSWNGKYRRPAGLATPDYQQPMKGELLWVYEGLTMYVGNVLAARCGLWSNASFREDLALIAAQLDAQPGRTWRPLSDTTVAAQLLYEARPEGAAWRRSVDFYPEGVLIWLEADVLIRQKTNGRRSIEDFCRKFYGGESGAPKVVPYTFDDVVAALNDIAPNDWKQFFIARVYTATRHAPLGGVEGSGWRLAFTNAPTDMLKAIESDRKTIDLSYSLGLVLNADGGILDVIPGSPADRAGMASTMKLIGVNGRRWSDKILRAAVAATKAGGEPLELLVENEEFFKTCKLDYSGGEKYPTLVRDQSKPDLLTKILQPLAPAPTVPGQGR